MSNKVIEIKKRPEAPKLHVKVVYKNGDIEETFLADYVSPVDDTGTFILIGVEADPYPMVFLDNEIVKKIYVRSIDNVRET